MMPAAGVTKAQVRIVGYDVNDRPNTKLYICFKGMTLLTTPLCRSDGDPMLWYADADLSSGAGVAVTSLSGGTYVTESDVHDEDNGIRSGVMVRNVNAYNIAEDAFSDTKVILNSTARNIDPAGNTSLHPDVAQYFPADNVILYGLTATQGMVSVQGISGQANRDMAIVNVVTNTPGNAFYMDARDVNPVRHLYIKDCIFAGGATSWSLPSAYTPKTVCVNVVVENSFHDMARTVPLSQSLGAYPGVTYRTGTGISEKQGTDVANRSMGGRAALHKVFINNGNVPAAAYDLHGRPINSSAPLQPGIYFVKQ
jgi:hypothetical protein